MGSSSVIVLALQYNRRYEAADEEWLLPSRAVVKEEPAEFAEKLDTQTMPRQCIS